MTKQTEALEMAHTTFMQINERFPRRDNGDGYFDKEIIACKEALAEQPTQEPVAWQALCGDNHYACGPAEMDLKGYHSDFWQRPLYTHPPKQWQGLSDEEYTEIRLSQEQEDNRTSEMLRKVEAKLRERNNG
jgi:hypothetical protein